MIKIASELIMFKIMDKIVNITARAGEKRNNKLKMAGAENKIWKY